jgi:hypothetical protein
MHIYKNRESSSFHPLGLVSSSFFSEIGHDLVTFGERKGTISLLFNYNRKIFWLILRVSSAQIITYVRALLEGPLSGVAARVRSGCYGGGEVMARI